MVESGECSAMRVQWLFVEENLFPSFQRNVNERLTKEAGQA